MKDGYPRLPWVDVDVYLVVVYIQSQIEEVTVAYSLVHPRADLFVGESDGSLEGWVGHESVWVEVSLENEERYR